MLEPRDLIPISSCELKLDFKENHQPYQLDCLEGNQNTMLRPAVAALSVSSSAQQTTIPTLASRSYSRRSKPALQTSEGEVSATKKWLAAHDGKPEMIPRSIAEIKRGTR